MKPALPLQFILGVAALGGAFALLWPAPATGFSHTGDVLGPDQRDFRIFNNFADPSANDNLTEHPSFPGHLGAVVAIWKASVEWGSELHGDGEGDPHQPGDLGSGGANFDAWFRGAATSVGGVNDNIHSAISSLPGGVVAFTETPTSDGWRIRYGEDYVWADGPDVSLPIGQIDLQAVATHEYGHAIGLGHSSVAGATMGPTVSGNGIGARSIEADDAAGIQAIYGAAAPGKPHVDAVVSGQGNILVSGEGFAPFNNEIWGTDYVIPGLMGIPGGQILFAPLPAGAGPGDVLGYRGTIIAPSISNAMPFDPTPACGTVAYGVGAGAANTGILRADAAPSPGQSLLLDLELFGTAPAALVVIGGGPQAVLALGGVILVTLDMPALSFALPLVGGTGQISIALPPNPALVGKTFFAQAGAPAPLAPQGVALSNGMAVTICP